MFFVEIKLSTSIFQLSTFMLTPSPPPPTSSSPSPLVQGPALRTIMHFVEVEPSLCVSAAKFVGSAAATATAAARTFAGEGTIWGGLFAELVRVLVLGPCSMEPKLLKALGDDYVNVHDDLR